MKFKILGLLILVFTAIQLIPTTIVKNRPIGHNKEYIKATNSPLQVNQILKESCYDCHSNQTDMPWYSKVAPISWLINHDIEEGREHLNFSEWTDYDKAVALHKVEECYEMIENGEMPMKGYTIMHPSAKLTPEKKNQLLTWFGALKNSVDKEMQQQKIEYYDGDGD